MFKQNPLSSNQIKHFFDADGDVSCSVNKNNVYLWSPFVIVDGEQEEKLVSHYD